MEYNAKGQRKTILYGNLAQTKYTYDSETFRLKRLLTTRNAGSDILQDLIYTFDCVGNIVAQKDDAQQTLYFQNSVVSPEGKYKYDSLYRLLKATGREHYGQAQVRESDFPINTPVPFNNSSTSVENYTEQYEYDEIGNILKLIHQAGSGNWTRGYHYGTANNRLLKTSLPGDTVSDPGSYSATYTHDVHGNMTSMPHLSDMKWDFEDQLKEVDLGGGGTAWYVYSGGVRVRKVIENGSLTKDRLYLDETNEFYREYISGSKDYERETLHVMDDRKRLAVVETKTYESGSPVGTPTPVIRYNFDNHLGSACLELDTSANIISYEEYHPFGTSSYRLGDTQAEVSLKRYRYVGKERDDETGLYYYGARYYAAWLCRFVSVDPLKDDYPYLTVYNYAGNKPITHFDIDGMQGTGDEKIETRSSSNQQDDNNQLSNNKKSNKIMSIDNAENVDSNGPTVSKSSSKEAPETTKVGRFFRNYLPGLIAAPLAGLVDSITGLGRLSIGLIKGNKEIIKQGAREALGGVLSMIGLKEIFMEGSDEAPTSAFKLPKSINQEMRDIQERVWTHPSIDNPQRNGMHAWHAGTNAALTNKLGPIGGLLVWIGGLIHETPIDRQSFRAEHEAQGTVNHIIDSVMDVVANTFGMIMGLLLPKKWAIGVSTKLGNFIPGPGDPDPHGTGGGGYTGKPSDAWFQWPKWNRSPVTP